MDITIDKYILNKKSKSLDQLGMNPETSARIALVIITKIINNYFDGGFTLSRKANVIDTRYWKKISSRVGLPMSSYMGDILPIIRNYEREMNE